jgi:hypothetical protein
MERGGDWMYIIGRTCSITTGLRIWEKGVCRRYVESIGKESRPGTYVDLQFTYERSLAEDTGGLLRVYLDRRVSSLIGFEFGPYKSSRVHRAQALNDYIDSWDNADARYANA